jgi:hypothetical protein
MACDPKGTTNSARLFYGDGASRSGYREEPWTVSQRMNCASWMLLRALPRTFLLQPNTALVRRDECRYYHLKTRWRRSRLRALACQPTDEPAVVDR